MLVYAVKILNCLINILLTLPLRRLRDCKQIFSISNFFVRDIIPCIFFTYIVAIFFLA